MDPILVNIACGVAGGLIVLAIQEIINYFKKQKEEKLLKWTPVT